ncbi:polygalacturonase 1 [Terfezia claveryi]|nr:polygalacturonase 1 [Terfezia claveryi]
MQITIAILVALLQFATTVSTAHARQWRRAKPVNTSCTVTSFDDLATVKERCGRITIGDLEVPAGRTLDLTKLKAGTTVLFTGKVTFGYKQWLGPLVSVSGTNITVAGKPGNVLDGRGASWWDGKGSNGGKTKPKFFFAHGLNTAVIRGLYILNTPVHCFSIGDCKDVLIDSVTIDNRAGDEDDLGHNTDGFDIGTSTGITINNATVYNQDDCIAINSGKNIKFTNGYCSGGHGLSIGSVGNRKDNVVQNVMISSSTVVNSVQALRIKTIHGATGSVSNITYSNIKLEGITKYAIVIQQDYLNGSPTGKPTSGVPIKHVTLSHVSGTLESKGKSKYILCASCSDFNFSNVELVSTSGKPVESECKGAPPGANC